MTESASSQDVVTCPQCGSANEAGANFCENCGAALSSPAAETLVVAVEQPTPLKHLVAHETDIGRRHHVNQDSGGAWTWMRPDGPASLAVVADGVSAGRHSEVASELTVQLIHDRLAPMLQSPSADLEDVIAALVEASRAANREVAGRPHHSLASADATTLVAAACINERGAGVWCGDSRAYLASGRAVRPLTRDHSWAEGVVSNGLMTAEEAARDPRARMITRWLGPPDEGDPGIESFRFTLEPDDTLLCCTDGLYMYFSPPVAEEDEMARILAEADSLQAAVDQMVDLAYKRGGHDNITLAAIQGQAADGAKRKRRVREKAETTLRLKRPDAVEEST